MIRDSLHQGFMVCLDFLPIAVFLSGGSLKWSESLGVSQRRPVLDFSGVKGCDTHGLGLMVSGLGLSHRTWNSEKFSSLLRLRMLKHSASGPKPEPYRAGHRRPSVKYYKPSPRQNSKEILLNPSTEMRFA